MVSNLPMTLNSLVSNGIISNVDAAEISGESVGRGRPEAKLPGQPTQDEFVNKTGVATWKKAAAAVLVGGVATFAGIKYKDKIVEKFNKIFHKKSVADTTTSAAAGTAAGTAAPVQKESLIKRIQSKITSYGDEAKTKFPNMTKKLESAKTFVTEKWNAIPKGVKIGGAIAAGLLALLVAFGHKSTAPTTPAAKPTEAPVKAETAPVPTAVAPPVAPVAETSAQSQLSMDQPIMAQPPKV